jgi:hypothetical protein
VLTWPLRHLPHYVSLALRAEVDALATFLTAHPDYVAASDDEYHAALAELPAGGLYSP